MKKHVPALLLLLFILGFSACGNLEKRLVKQEGTWALTSEHRLEVVDNDVVNDTTTTDLGTLVFRDNGTGSKWFTTDTTEFEWTYNSVTEQVSILQQSINFVYNVLEDNKDSQTWQNIAEISSAGTVARVETTWELKRE